MEALRNICFNFLLSKGKRIRSLISFSIIMCYQRLYLASRQHLTVTKQHPLLLRVSNQLLAEANSVQCCFYMNYKVFLRFTYMKAQHSIAFTTKSSCGASGSLPYVLHC